MFAHRRHMRNMVNIYVRWRKNFVNMIKLYRGLGGLVFFSCTSVVLHVFGEEKRSRYLRMEAYFEVLFAVFVRNSMKVSSAR